MAEEERNKKNKLMWSREIRKRRRNCGLNYTTTGGKNVLAKQPPEEATCKCQFACRTINRHHRRKLFEDFYEMVNYNKQQSYLRQFVQSSEIRQRKNGTYRDPSESRRQKTIIYNLPLPNGDETRVCRKTFLETFRIKPGRIRVLSEKIAHGFVDVSDARGGNRKCTELEIPISSSHIYWLDKIKEHIASFPAEKFHNDSPDQLYLSPDLNLPKMYKGFQAKYHHPVTKKQPPVSSVVYRNVFKKYFKLSFKAPKKGTCTTCDTLRISRDVTEDPGSKNAAELLLNQHHTKVEKSQKLIKHDTRNESHHVLSFDLQERITLPTLRHKMLHSHQLNCYNLSIHDEFRNKGIMCLWTEDLGGCGSTEVSSCLYRYLTREVKACVKNLTLWSDNICGEQNQNQYIIAMLLTLIAKGYFDEITQKFLIKGHTYMSCDKDIDLVERKRQGEALQTIKDVAQLIGGAVIKNPFDVLLIDGFCNWKEVAERAFISTDNLYIREACQVRVSRENFGKVYVSYDYEQRGSWTCIRYLKEGFDIKFFENLNVQEVNTSEGLNDVKKADLGAILFDLPMTARKYFQNILQNSVVKCEVEIKDEVEFDF